ncbi:hypothetical protein [Microvirga aerophila]|uniref:Uncharacterized protein n=2 Tax=Microvirga aerophila TaxID=670291 RepID=A0A512C5I3_9HYPH|nr:hypothetical protein [Microvirga aerophila]GEO19420.1 hypothetical protein MAE02_71160 [Microvirga aerophila]
MKRFAVLCAVTGVVAVHSSANASDIELRCTGWYYPSIEESLEPDRQAIPAAAKANFTFTTREVMFLLEQPPGLTAFNGVFPMDLADQTSLGFRGGDKTGLFSKRPEVVGFFSRTDGAAFVMSEPEILDLKCSSAGQLF